MKTSLNTKLKITLPLKMNYFGFLHFIKLIKIFNIYYLILIEINDFSEMF